jgi:hypothetical protein
MWFRHSVIKQRLHVVDVDDCIALVIIVRKHVHFTNLLGHQVDPGDLLAGLLGKVKTVMCSANCPV